MNLEKFLPIFENLNGLFEKYYLHHDIFDQVLKSIKENDIEGFKKLAVSNNFFGGSGALWEITPDADYKTRIANTDAPDYSNDEIENDRQKFYQLFIDLINELSAQDVKEGRINQVLEYVTSMKRAE